MLRAWAESRKPGDGLIHETKLLFPSFTMSKRRRWLVVGTDKRETIQAPQPQRQQSAELLVAELGDLHSPMPLNVVAAMRQPKTRLVMLISNAHDSFVLVDFLAPGWSNRPSGYMLSGAKSAFSCHEKGRLSKVWAKKLRCFAKTDLGQWVGQPDLPVRELRNVSGPKLTQSSGHQDLVPGTLQSGGSAGLAQSPVRSGTIMGRPLTLPKPQLVIALLKVPLTSPGRWSPVLGAKVWAPSCLPKLAS
jgi:hypothetical protein